MNRVHSYSALQVVASADLNGIQDNAAGLAQLNGQIVWSGQLYSLDGTTIVIGAIQQLYLSGAAPLSVATTTTITPSVVANTWYYIYAYNNAGAVAFETSTTAPDAYLCFKTGDTTRRYLGCYLVNGTPKIVPFRAAHGRYVWRVSANLQSTLTANNLSSTTVANLPLVAAAGTTQKLIPPHARLIDMQIEGQSLNTTTNGTVYIYSEADTLSPMLIPVGNAPAAGFAYNSLVASFDVGTTQTLGYKVSDANMKLSNAYAIGFQE